MTQRLKSRIDPRRGLAAVSHPAPDELAWLGAAFLMTEQAYVSLGRSGRGRSAVLRPKKGRALKALAESFERQYADQLRRWALARLERGARARALGGAFAFAARPAEPAGAETGRLGDEQKAEIERLLAEARGAPADPLGIRVPWEQLRGKPA